MVQVIKKKSEQVIEDCVRKLFTHAIKSVAEESEVKLTASDVATAVANLEGLHGEALFGMFESCAGAELEKMISESENNHEEEAE